MKAGKQKVLGVEEVLKKCVEEVRLEPARVNVVSATSRAFVECYLKTRVDDYIAHFSRLVSEAIYRAFECGRISEILTETSKRLDTIASSLAETHHIFDMRLTTDSRLVIDTRNPIFPLEISIAWDPMLNVPFIPSTSLKGRARAYFELNNVEVDGLKTYELFGTQSSEGVVLFTDAYPVSCRGKHLVEPDVLTPHYSEARYAIDEASASPVPIVFLTVSPRVTFRFLIAIDKKFKAETSVKVANEISKALSTGVGAKTAVGYGRLKVERHNESQTPSTTAQYYRA